jgi:hypothetical protein
VLILAAGSDAFYRRLERLPVRVAEDREEEPTKPKPASPAGRGV